MSAELCPKCYSVVVIDRGRRCEACGWHGISTATLNEYTVIEIPLDQIWSDDEFNCRGSIAPIDVVDLVKDIDRNGLQFPIAVQPINDVKVENSTNALFRIVAGHRRFQSFRILKKETIPVMVKVGLTEVQARLLNLGENLKRKALNVLQEALAIERLRNLGLNRRQVSEELGVSTSWVQVRFNLLDLPDVIQQEAAAGILNQHQIKELYSLKDKGEQCDAVKKIKNARLRGEKSVSVSKSPAQDPFKKRRQPRSVVQDMMTHLGNTVGHGLHTRVLAWANGVINSAELYFDIQRHAKENGLEYKVPLAGQDDQERAAEQW